MQFSLSQVKRGSICDDKNQYLNSSLTISYEEWISLSLNLNKI